jgi:ArsR family transcriptional regulator, lead/cadmium/zinc/bismuth-responsive transcriptional repressor
MIVTCGNIYFSYYLITYIITMDHPTELSQFYKALGDETRLRLVALLAQQEPGNALCVGKLARELDSTSSNISQHIRILKSLGLLRSRRSGYKIHYFLDQEQFHYYQSLAISVFGKTLNLPNQPIKEEETHVL